MPRTDRSWDKVALNLALVAGSLLLAAGCLELVVRGLGLFAEARLVSAELSPVADGDESAIRTVLHPYLGWVKKPGLPGVARQASGGEDVARRKDSNSGALASVNLLGFSSQIEDYRLADEGDFNIGCFGGSVAEDLCLKDGDLIAEELERRRPDLAGSVRVLNFASHSYKQPQQLFTLAMALALEVHLDAIVSLDGFNEVAIGGDGARKGHHPLWPSRSALLSTIGMASGRLSEEEILATAEILGLRRRAADRRALLSKHPILGSLETTRALVGLLVLRDEAAANRAEAVFQERPVSLAAESVVALPDECLEGSDLRTVAPVCWDLIADLWAQSTLATDAVARRNEIPFLHLLQPNQYVPGSKPLSDEEKTFAISEQQRWGDYVREGYPALRSRRLDLERRGVQSVDLTGIFADHPETLYRDTCCHINRAGNRLLAARIAELISERI